MARRNEAASIPSPQQTSRRRQNAHVLNAAASRRPRLPAPQPAAFPVRTFSYAPEPATAQARPLYFSSMLPAPQPAAIHAPSVPPPTTGQQIDQILASHNQNLKNALVVTVNKQAEEEVARKIHEKELELQAKMRENEQIEEKLEQYKGQIARLLTHTRNWERTIAHLQRKLQEFGMYQPGADFGEEESAESSYVNTGQVAPVRLDCVVCKKFVANVMMWTCRHVCVCTECNEVTRRCPVCDTTKISSIEVCIPTYD